MLRGSVIASVTYHDGKPNASLLIAVTAEPFLCSAHYAAPMVSKYRAAKLRRVYVREWLDYLDMEQAELADLMGTDPANVSRWISEPWRITLDILSGMADALAPKSPEIAADAGNLMRHPMQAVALRQFQDAIRQLAKPPDAPLPGKRR